MPADCKASLEAHSANGSTRETCLRSFFSTQASSSNPLTSPAIWTLISEGSNRVMRRIPLRPSQNGVGKRRRPHPIRTHHSHPGNHAASFHNAVLCVANCVGRAPSPAKAAPQSMPGATASSAQARVGADALVRPPHTQTYQECTEPGDEEKARMSKSGQQSRIGQLRKPICGNFLSSPPAEPVSRKLFIPFQKIFPANHGTTSLVEMLS